MDQIFSGIGAALAAAVITFAMNYVHHIRRDRKNNALQLYEAIETARHNIASIAISMSQVARRWNSYESAMEFLLQSGSMPSSAESRVSAIVKLEFPHLTQHHQDFVKKIKEINATTANLALKNPEYQTNEKAEEILSLKDEMMDKAELLRDEALEIARESVWQYILGERIRTFGKSYLRGFLNSCKLRR